MYHAGRIVVKQANFEAGCDGRDQVQAQLELTRRTSRDLLTAAQISSHAMETHVVTIYSRPGCHLCDVAKANILASRLRDSFRIVEVNVDADEALKQEYGDDVPVVLIDGIKVFKHAVATDDFERKLRRFNRS